MLRAEGAVHFILQQALGLYDAPNSLVFAIDDDASVRKGLARCSASGVQKRNFRIGSDFLAHPPHARPSCVIVDVPDARYQRDGISRNSDPASPEEQLVFITGHGDIPMCAQAMKAGA